MKDPKLLPTSDPIPFAGSDIDDAIWPVETSHPKKYEVNYHATDDADVGSHPGRQFLARRSNGTRYHVAVDIFASHRDRVVACEDGRIVSYYGFYPTSAGEMSYALFVAHEDFVANYGEVKGDAQLEFGWRVGDQVRKGQGIARVSTTEMIHFETYIQGTAQNERWIVGGPRPQRLLNPTLYLLNLAASAQGITHPAAANDTEGYAEILQIAADSDIARYDWRNRGRAPRGYIKGMALVFARAYCKLKAGDSFAIEMAKAESGDASHDALTHYRNQFVALGMDNSGSGPDTLRHLFVLLMGLGMRESSGNYCEGRDLSASNTSAETAEAGLFQTSFNACSANPLMGKLFEQYQVNPSGFVEVFAEGASCSESDAENFGSGPGSEFQRLSKECPAFAAELAALGLRNVRKHWGPINSHKAEIRPASDEMFKQVQAAIDRSGFCSKLV
jgi:hypothetical protein